MSAIRDQGPDASLVDMAAVAGVSKPVLYDEFGDKRGVADAIAVFFAGRLEQQVVSELTTGEPINVEIAIQSFVTALIELIDSEPNIYAFLVRQIRSSERGFLDNALVEVIHERGLMLIRLFVAGGGGVDEAELELVTDATFGMVFGAVESWQSRRTTISKERLVKTLSTMIETGLLELAGRERG